MTFENSFQQTGKGSDWYQRAFNIYSPTSCIIIFFYFGIQIFNIFYSTLHIQHFFSDVAYDEATNADTEKSDIEIVKQNINNITFRWNNVTVNNLQNVSNIYLVVLQVSNKFYTNAQNVLGLVSCWSFILQNDNQIHHIGAKLIFHVLFPRQSW